MTAPKYDLPTAMRKGAKMRPKALHVFFESSDASSCALGAAYEGETGFGESWQVKKGLEHMWPELDMQIDDYRNLFQAICFLNDNARWTREEIADWVDMVLP